MSTNRTATNPINHTNHTKYLFGKAMIYGILAQLCLYLLFYMKPDLFSIIISGIIGISS